MSRAAVTAGALCPATTGATAICLASLATGGGFAFASHRAQTDTQGASPRAHVAAVGIAKKRLHVRAGRRVAVVGSVRPGTPGLRARLQIRRNGRWATIDRDRTAGSGRYLLRNRRRSPMSARARVRVSGVKQRVGRVNVYRWANASWYGPGLYGNRTGCGGTLHAGRMGVAHRTLPCGSRVTLRHRGRTVRVRVIDRGPYVGGREYDLTERTAKRLRFRGHGPILTTR